MEHPQYWYEGDCVGCGQVRPLTDRDLCVECDRCFDRDLVRLRQWDLSGLATELPAGEYEALRRRIIAEHGGTLELLVLDRKVGDRRRGC